MGKCDLKIAERDFYVYKLGRVSDRGFISLYQNFIYVPRVLNEKIKMRPIIIDNYSIHKLLEEQYGIIYEGYHSYKDITMPYSDLGAWSRTIYLGRIAENVRLHNIYSIATFVIPKGSKYYENGEGEIVSSDIIYTGKYVEIGNSVE